MLSGVTSFTLHGFSRCWEPAKSFSYVTPHDHFRVLFVVILVCWKTRRSTLAKLVPVRLPSSDFGAGCLFVGLGVRCRLTSPPFPRLSSSCLHADFAPLEHEPFADHCVQFPVFRSPIYVSFTGATEIVIPFHLLSSSERIFCWPFKASELRHFKLELLFDTLDSWFSWLFVRWSVGPLVALWVPPRPQHHEDLFWLFGVNLTKMIQKSILHESRPFQLSVAKCFWFRLQCHQSFFPRLIELPEIVAHQLEIERVVRAHDSHVNNVDLGKCADHEGDLSSCQHRGTRELYILARLRPRELFS